MHRLAPIAALFGLAALVPVAGCGDSSGGGATGSSPKNRLIGKWEGKLHVDRQAFEARFTKKGQNAMAASIAKKMVDTVIKKLEDASMTMDFRRDATFRGTASGIPGKDRDISGTWKIIDSSEDRLEVEIETNGKKERSVLVFRGKDEFLLESNDEGQKIPEGVEFRFRRVD